jgi:large subunit ribosomal protein L10
MTETKDYAAKVRPEKVAAVEEIKQSLGDTQAVLLTEYRGLTVTELAQLRGQLLGQETAYRVVKNTLASRAATDAGLEGLVELFVGPTAVAYVKGDPVSAAKILATFAREHPALVIKGGVLDGRVLSADETKALATVDQLDVSRAKIAGLLTAALRQIMMLAEAPARQILYVLEQIVERAPQEAEPVAEAQADAAAPAEEAPEAEAAPAAEEVAASAEPEAVEQPEEAPTEATEVTEVTEEQKEGE